MRYTLSAIAFLAAFSGQGDAEVTTRVGRYRLRFGSEAAVICANRG